MNLFLFIGPGAVGKTRVGQEFADRVQINFMGNHDMIEPALSILGFFDMDLIEKLRFDIFDYAIENSIGNMAYSFCWNFKREACYNRFKRLVEHLKDKLGDTPLNLYIVELDADFNERLKRNQSEYRLNRKFSKRDIEASEEILYQELEIGRYNSEEGEIEKDFGNLIKGHIRIDNTNMSVEDQVDEIIAQFDLMDDRDECYNL
jgi:hypothetical protein